VEALAQRAAGAIGEAVYAIGTDAAAEDGLEAAVGHLLRARGARLFLAETASGGALARRCAGADWFAGATVAADPPGLAAQLGVDLPADPGEAARYLAERLGERVTAGAVLVQCGAYTVADLRADSVRVEIHFALAGPGGVRRESRWLSGGLARKQNSAAALGLDFLRRALSG
jgi:hypothetical protein